MGGQKCGTDGLDVRKAIEFSMRAKHAARVTSSIPAFLGDFLPRNETAEIEAEKAKGLSSDVQGVIDQDYWHEQSERSLRSNVAVRSGRGGRDQRKQ